MDGKIDLDQLMTQRPLTTKALLDLYEGLAVNCEEIRRAKDQRKDSRHDEVLRRRCEFYEAHVGVSPFERKQLRAELAKRLEPK